MDDDGGVAKKRKLNDSMNEQLDVVNELDLDVNMMPDDNYHNQLRQFDVLDEVQGDETDSDGSRGMIKA